MIDKFDINDSLGMRGFVILRDTKTGKILVEKHNMILQDAKHVLLSMFLNGVTLNWNDGKTPAELGDNALLSNKYILSDVVFFNSTKEIAYTDKYSLIPADDEDGKKK